MRSLFTNAGELLVYETYHEGSIADFIKDVQLTNFNDKDYKLKPQLVVDQRYNIDNGVKRYILKFDNIESSEEFLIYVKY